MKLNKLGTTDMNLSQIALGGAAFSNFYGSFNEAISIELIRTSLQRGVNYIDTGPWYGQGSSELTLGKALKGVSRELFYIGGKVGRYELQVENMFDFSAEKTNASIDCSLERLKLDYLDIIQVHDPTFAPDVSIILRETLPTLAKAVENGKARYIGLADYDVGLMKDIIEESEIKISSILSYAKSTMLDNSLQHYTDYFMDKGVGVINAAGNAMGLLTSRGAQPWHPACAEIKQICKQAAAYCTENGVELARLAQWFTMNQPNISTSVIGIQDLTQLEQALGVLSSGLTEHEMKVFNTVQERYFKGQRLHWDNVELPLYRAKLSNKLKST